MELWELLLQAVNLRLGEAEVQPLLAGAIAEAEGRGGPPRTEALALL